MPDQSKHRMPKDHGPDCLGDLTELPEEIATLEQHDGEKGEPPDAQGEAADIGADSEPSSADSLI
jgi:hypothetical protein